MKWFLEKTGKLYLKDGKVAVGDSGCWGCACGCMVCCKPQTLRLTLAGINLCQAWQEPNGNASWTPGDAPNDTYDFTYKTGDSSLYGFDSSKVITLDNPIGVFKDFGANTFTVNQLLIGLAYCPGTILSEFPGSPAKGWPNSMIVSVSCGPVPQGSLGYQGSGLFYAVLSGSCADGWDGDNTLSGICYNYPGVIFGNVMGQGGSASVALCPDDSGD